MNQKQYQERMRQLLTEVRESLPFPAQIDQASGKTMLTQAVDRRLREEYERDSQFRKAARKFVGSHLY